MIYHHTDHPEPILRMYSKFLYRMQVYIVRVSECWVVTVLFTFANMQLSEREVPTECGLFSVSV